MIKKGSKIIVEGKTYHNARCLCKTMGISSPFLKQLTDAKMIPYIVFGKRKFFNIEDVESSIQFKNVDNNSK